MKPGGERQIVRQLPDLDVSEAAPCQQCLVLPGIADSDVTIDLRKDAPVLEALHEVLRVRRM